MTHNSVVSDEIVNIGNWSCDIYDLSAKNEQTFDILCDDDWSRGSDLFLDGSIFFFVYFVILRNVKKVSIEFLKSEKTYGS